MPQQTRPLIGINADFVPAIKHTGRSPRSHTQVGNEANLAHVRLNAGYFEAVLAAGGLPVIVPPFIEEREIDSLLDRLEGVVLSSGPDLDPRRLGQPSHPAVQVMAERRQQSDQVLVRRIVDRQIPLLAVALGMQQLNVGCGGTLYLHLPEDLPRALPHRDLGGGPHRHAVLLEPNTRIDEIYGGGEIRVNSCHHQAVRRIGAGLRVGALAPDGVIEAIETDDPNWFCVGIQWHPESETASALDMQLFECFVQACLRQSQSLQLAA